MTANQQDLLAAALERCASEPIHLAGAIQDHGILLAFDDAGILRMASDNLQSVFSQAAQDALEHPVARLIGENVIAQLQKLSFEDNSKDIHPIRFSTIVNGQEVKLTAIAHRTGQLTVVELESEVIDRIGSANLTLPAISQRLSRLDRHDNIISFCQGITEELYPFTGFDRIKVYRFDHHWNGEIIAESKNNTLPSYLHHYFPASDIPPQARALYERNLIRFLADTHAPAVPVIPALNPLTGKPLDLSFSIFRAVSPVHIEYLHNMGVRSTITLSLMHEGRLWGLVTCHNAQPQRISHDLRDILAFMGNIFSIKLTSLLNMARAQAMDTVRRQLQDLTGLIRHTHDINTVIQASPNEFLKIAGATGSYFAFDNNSYTIGTIPSPKELLPLTGWIKQQQLTNGIFITDNLAALYPPAQAFTESASGLLAVALDYQNSNFIFWFRPERICDIPWAGNPNKQITTDALGPRLDPRRSFALWLATARGFSEPWLDTDIDAVKLFSFAIVQMLMQQARRHADMIDSANRAKSEFISRMSHELRTPMNAILGFTQLMEFDGNLCAQHKQYLYEIHKAGDHLLLLIDEVLDLAKIESGHIHLSLETVAVLPLINECLTMTKPIAQKRSLRISHTCPVSLCITADRVRLKQLLLNLISNAIKYNREGGTIRIEAQPKRDEHVRILVADTGYGIPAERMSGLFQPFNRLGAEKSATEGTGLGLSISRHIAELMNGSIGVDSQAGTGSTFWIELPDAAPLTAINESQTVTDTGSMMHTAITPATQRTVLYIEDNPVNFKLMAQILNKRQHIHLLAAHAAAFGVELAETHFPDLILLDINMPEMDGYQVLQRLRANPRLTATPIIAVTANAMDTDVARGKAAGFTDYVIKPIDIKQLLRIVDRYLTDPPVSNQ